MTVMDNLLSKWRSEHDQIPSMEPAKRALRQVASAHNEVLGFQSRILSNDKLTKLGQLDEARKYIADMLAPQMQYGRRAVSVMRSKLAEERKRLEPKAPDKSDIARAFLRSDIRNYVRAMGSPLARGAFLLHDGADPLTWESVLEGPGFLSGIDGDVRHRVMAAAIEHSDAQERGLVVRNTVRELRGRRKRGKERHATQRAKGNLKIGVDIPAPEEIRLIIQALDGSRWRPFLLTAILTGLRASELRGLRWQDVDLRKSELHVRQRADRYRSIGKPKTAAGERTVPMPPALVTTLREWKLACPPTEHDLVFPTIERNRKDGSKVGGTVQSHVNIIQRGLIPIMVKAGVTVPAADNNEVPIIAAKYTGLHALRHFYASWCINRKADGGLELPAKVVQHRLGHSSITVTLDTYGHLFPRGDDGAELAEAERALMG